MKILNNYKKFNVFFWIVVLVLTLIGCNDEADEQRKLDWIENEVNLRIDNYRAERLAECKAKIWEEVEVYVDSLLANNDLFLEIVDDAIPDKPMKPNFVPLDTQILQEHRVERFPKN